MKPDSLLCSQETVIGPYPEPSPHAVLKHFCLLMKIKQIFHIFHETRLYIQKFKHGSSIFFFYKTLFSFKQWAEESTVP